MNYDVEFFIKKFEAIPEEMWHMGELVNGGARCALGHCGLEGPYSLVRHNREAMSLANLLIKFNDIAPEFPNGEAKMFWTVAKINDGHIDKYQQPTPKQRILAALYDIKKLQEKVSPAIHEHPAPAMKFTKFDEMKSKTELVYAN